MSSIIPRNLIKHLEWVPGQSPQRGNQSTGQSAGNNPINQGAMNVRPDLSKYIQLGIPGIHGGPAIISPFELEGYKNMQYEPTHLQLLENGIYMPNPRILMTHFNNIISAHKDKRKLIYADGSEVSQDVVEDLFKHFTINHKNSYGDDNIGSWTWLNAKFIQGTGQNNLDLETVIGLPSGKKKKLEVRTEPLVDCLMEDAYIDISFNNQGLAERGSKSSKQEYNQGRTIYFWNPRKDFVARFGTDSDRACLNCYGIPQLSSASLGVFGCAEGAHKKNSEGSS